jgi:hypothetical protein
MEPNTAWRGDVTTAKGMEIFQEDSPPTLGSLFSILAIKLIPASTENLRKSPEKVYFTASF